MIVFILHVRMIVFIFANIIRVYFKMTNTKHFDGCDSVATFCANKLSFEEVGYLFVVVANVHNCCAKISRMRHKLI